MNRPVPEDQITVNDAIAMIMKVEFEVEHDDIQYRYRQEKQSFDLIGADSESKASEVKFSKALIELHSDLYDKTRILLRRWLRNGKIRSFYSDPRYGGDVELDRSAWGLAITDSAINGGDYLAGGDSGFAGPVGLHFGDLLAILIGGDQSTIPPRATSAAHSNVEVNQAQTCFAKSEMSIGSIASAVEINPSTSTLAAPAGKDGMREGVKIALQDIYGPSMGLGIRPYVRKNAVHDWLRARSWQVPSDLARTINRILRPFKIK